VVYLEGGRPAHGSWLPSRLPGDEAAVLRWLVPDVADRVAYLCGPPAWMAAVRRTLRAAGLAADRIHSEEFAW
jgi:ferredoxin-NADP reductase